MKIIYIPLLFSALAATAQVSVTPFFGLNSTRMTQTTGYVNGGNYPVFGAEVEYVFNRDKYSKVNWSIVSGASYLANGFDQINTAPPSYSVNGNSYTLGTYDLQATQIQMNYWQVPLIVRMNVRPFPLLEDWRLFFGLGVVNNNLTYAHLAEQWTFIAKSVRDYHWYYANFPPPVITQAQDSRNVTSYARKSSMFGRFEFGIKFKHFQVTYRLTFSTQDMYFKGIESVWNVPAAGSQYISAHNARGITKEKYSELVFGWRFH